MAHACVREGERRREKERGRKPASAKYCINKCTGRNIHGRAKPSSPPPLLSTIFTALSTFPSLYGLLFYSVDHQAAPAEPDIHSASFLLFTYKRDTQPPSRKARIYSWESLSVAGSSINSPLPPKRCVCVSRVWNEVLRAGQLEEWSKDSREQDGYKFFSDPVEIESKLSRYVFELTRVPRSVFFSDWKIKSSGFFFNARIVCCIFNHIASFIHYSKF